jgi:hypothetical protein
MAICYILARVPAVAFVQVAPFYHTCGEQYSSGWILCCSFNEVRHSPFLNLSQMTNPHEVKTIVCFREKDEISWVGAGKMVHLPEGMR